MLEIHYSVGFSLFGVLLIEHSTLGDITSLFLSSKIMSLLFLHKIPTNPSKK